MVMYTTIHDPSSLNTSRSKLFLCEKCFNLCAVYNFFGKDKCPRLWRALHLYTFRIANAFFLSRVSYTLLCHIRLSLLDFAMHCDTLQYWVVLPAFETLGSVFPILCGDIPRDARHPRGFVLRTLQDDLYACLFRLLRHSLYPLLYFSTFSSTSSANQPFEPYVGWLVDRSSLSRVSLPPRSSTVPNASPQRGKSASFADLARRCGECDAWSARHCSRVVLVVPLSDIP